MHNGTQPAPHKVDAGPSDRILAIDVIRTIAICMVVVNHVSSQIFKFLPLDSYTWWIGNFFFSLRGGAAFFFMVSGVVLLNPKRSEPIAEFLKRRFSRVVVPSLFWIGLYYLYGIVHDGFSPNLVSAVKAILTGPVYYHLWFVYALVPVYLAIPVLRLIVRDENRRHVEYLLMLWVMGTSLAPLLEKISGVRINLLVTMFANYSGFFVLGAYLYWFRAIQPKKWMAYSLVGVYAVILVGNYFLNRFGVRPDEYLLQRYSPLALFTIVVGFILLIRVDYARWYARFPRLRPGITLVARASFGIYVLHPMIADGITWVGQQGLHIRLSALMLHPVIGIPLFTLIVIGVCLGLVWLSRSISLMKTLMRYG